MGLTPQQQLYPLQKYKYYLLLMIGDNEICGIIDEYIAEQINKQKLKETGFYIEEIDFNTLYTQALTILKDEKII